MSVQVAGDSIASQKAPSNEAVTSAASQIAAAVNKAGECLISVPSTEVKTIPAANGSSYFAPFNFVFGYTMKAFRVSHC